MRAILFLVLGSVLFFFDTVGQSLDQKDFVELIRLAFEQNKLPNELVPKLDTLFRRSLPDSFVVVKTDEKLGIKRQYEDKADKVMVWEGEKIFVYNIRYWMMPLQTSRKKQKALIKYETTTYGKIPGEITRCYRGEITGKFDGKKWILVKSEFMDAECDFTHWTKEK